MTKELKTVAEILNLSAQFLQEKGITRAKRLVEELLSFQLQMPRLQLYMQFDRPMQEVELKPFREMLKRKAKGEPLEYILGKKRFYHCDFYLNSSVLIPRHETEILLDEAIKSIESSHKIAWDICCGSGCLGIALKKALPHLEVSLSDLSGPALEVAKRNAEVNQVEVAFFQGDLLEPFSGKKADLIFCNPPYISAAEYLQLDPEVRNFEPKEALVGGSEGIEFYQRLSQKLPSMVEAGGKVFLEIGYDQGEKVISLFSHSGWKAKSLKKDWAGHDRFIFLEKE